MCAAECESAASDDSADRLTPRKRHSVTTFRELGVLPEICDALERAGITTPFAIQEMTLSVALMGTDLIGQARTGTGKTLAFGIPVLQRTVAPHDPDYAELPQGKPQALDRRPDPRARAPGLQRPRPRQQGPRPARPHRLRRRGLRHPARHARVRRRRRRRHARPAHRPGEPQGARPLPRPRPGARRGRRDARPRLPARRRAAAAPDPRDPADDAVLGHHAGRDRGPGPHPHAAPDEHPRRVVVREHHGPGDRAVHLPGPRPRQARDHRPRAAGRGRRQDDRLHPHQAAGPARRRRPGRARLQGRRRCTATWPRWPARRR